MGFRGMCPSASGAAAMPTDLFGLDVPAVVLPSIAWLCVCVFVRILVLPLISMGCCTSSPYSARRYLDPADLEEANDDENANADDSPFAPLRTFGIFRPGAQVHVPDHVDGLFSTHIIDPNNDAHSHYKRHLAAETGDMLYTAEMDVGYPFRCCRPFYWACFVLPPGWVWLTRSALTCNCSFLSCDEVCCYVRKEYNTRSFYRVYANRIEYNRPSLRFPFGLLGCGSWNADQVLTHPFDRGAFGFQQVRAGVTQYLCCLFPSYGGVVARHRCQCYGPVWNRMCTDCGGWWCDEWVCQMLCCTYRYGGIAYPEEVAFASSIALQAYFEGRAITPAEMKQCVDYWKTHISERSDIEGRKRPVCCEPYSLPLLGTDVCCYHGTHPQRNIPYQGDDVTDHVRETYAHYEQVRQSQIDAYTAFEHPVQNATLCQALGCRRFFGRKGFCFCTEGCCDKSAATTVVAPPPTVPDMDDEWDAARVLIQVLGPPPANVVMKRWRWDADQQAHVLDTIVGKPTSSRKAVTTQVLERGEIVENDQVVVVKDD